MQNWWLSAEVSILLLVSIEKVKTVSYLHTLNNLSVFKKTFFLICVKSRNIDQFDSSTNKDQIHVNLKACKSRTKAYFEPLGLVVSRYPIKFESRFSSNKASRSQPFNFEILIRIYKFNGSNKCNALNNFKLSQKSCSLFCIRQYLRNNLCCQVGSVCQAL